MIKLYRLNELFVEVLCFGVLRHMDVLTISACQKVEEVITISDWQMQYDLGMKYLSEGNYEEAVIAFTAAIEIGA